MSRLVIIGAGGHGKVVADAAVITGKWSDIVFLDAAWPDRQECLGRPIVGSDTQLKDVVACSDAVVVAISDGRRRLALCDEVASLNLPLATVVHPSAVISPYARIEPGTVVLARAVINPDAVVGQAAIVNTGALVEHDCVVAAGAHICPGVSLAGGASVGSRSWLGIGSAVRQGIKIGADVTVGAGSVVVKDLPDGVTAFGVPAKIIRK